MTIVKNKIFWICIFLLALLAYGYRYSPYKVQFIGHYDKIWAHRVNSVEKLKSAVHYFKGVELDLEYDSRKNLLDVNHPPSESIGLNFEDYISNLKVDETPYMWLDIKNLNLNNCELIFKKLVTIFEAKNYPLEKVLIESTHPESLKNFSDNGFMTSYYLPSNLNLKTEIELKSEISKIKKFIDKEPQHGISTDYHDYKILKQYFPKHKKNIWILVSSFSTEFSTISDILNDSTVAVVLVNYKAIKGNR